MKKYLGCIAFGLSGGLFWEFVRQLTDSNPNEPIKLIMMFIIGVALVSYGVVVLLPPTNSFTKRLDKINAKDNTKHIPDNLQENV